MPENFYLNFEILDLPKMPNQLLGAHWTIRSGNAKKWLRYVEAAVVGRIPPHSLKNAALVLVRHSSVRPDFDGLSGSFKPILDALVKCGVLADDTPAVIGTPTYLWQKASPRNGKITVTIQQLSEAKERAE